MGNFLCPPNAQKTTPIVFSNILVIDVIAHGYPLLFTDILCTFTYVIAVLIAK